MSCIHNLFFYCIFYHEYFCQFCISKTIITITDKGSFGWIDEK